MALTDRIAVLITADGDQAVREFTKVGRAADKTGTQVEGKLTSGVNRGLQKLGIDATVTAGQLQGVLAAGAAAGAVALAKLASVSVDAASSLNEQMANTQVTFGAASDAVLEFGDNAANSIGLSNRAALEAANAFGAFFKAAGTSQETAAKLSQNVVRLAGDLASFKNLGTEDVLAKIRSGLSGEAEPLRALGVFLTETNVKAKAMELGLADAHGELSEGAKVIARYQLILDGTKDAQGDYARTSDSLANAQRTLQANVEDLEASIGRGLLPTIAGLVGGANDLLAVLDRLPGGFDNVTRFAVDAIPGVKELKFVFDLLPNSAHKTGEALQDLAADDLAAVSAASREARSELGKTIDEIFKTADAQDRLAETTSKIADLQREIVALPAGHARDVADAEDDLSEARRRQGDATERLSDAQKRLNELRDQDPAREIARAAADAETATARLAQAQSSVADAQSELARARDTGQSPNRIAEANANLQAAVAAVAQAQVDAADSQDKLNRTRTGQDRASAISDAEKQVADAQRAQREAADGAVEAQQKLNNVRAVDLAPIVAEKQAALNKEVRTEAQLRGDIAEQSGGLSAKLRAEMDVIDTYRGSVAGLNDEYERLRDIYNSLGTATGGSRPVSDRLGFLGGLDVSGATGTKAATAPTFVPSATAPTLSAQTQFYPQTSINIGTISAEPKEVVKEIESQTYLIRQGRPF